MLRDFQQDLQNRLFEAWQDPEVLNVMMVSPTGSGKTVILGDTITKLDRPTVAIAHRQELVGQLALALNRENVPHGIIAPKGVIQQIITLEMETHGYARYNPRSNTRVAAVDTLVRRDGSDPFYGRVELAVVDEGHHVLRGNKWGRAIAMLPRARGLFPTAHAIRADGAGLGRDAKTADGLVDRLVVGPCGRDLISRGFLTDYRLVCPPSHIDLAAVPIGSTGEYNQEKLRMAVHQDGAIVGDVVREYLRYGAGQLWITFAVDIESAVELAKAYRAAGVPAEVITGQTPLPIRAALMKKFRRREILMLVSVDVLGEGVDVPAVYGISMARPTASFQLYAQQCGRPLRPMIAQDHMDFFNSTDDAGRLAMIAGSPKPKSIIIDHVGNCHHFFEDHNFVDTPQRYTLNRREKTTREKKGDNIPLRTCLACLLPYEAYRTHCPECGEKHVPQGRAKPDQVDGDLFELDPAVRAQMMAAVMELDAPAIAYGTDVVSRSIAKNHRLRQHAQTTLRAYIATWAGMWQMRGASDAEIYRRFYFHFQVDILTAQALGRADAADLEARIHADLMAHNVAAPFTLEPPEDD